MVVLPLAELLIVHQVSEWLRGDGHHIGEDETAVAAGCQHQLVVAVVVADAPHPGTHIIHSELDGGAMWGALFLFTFMHMTKMIVKKAVCG